MEYCIVCPNDGSGCEWCGRLHKLENHLMCCPYRPAQCLYCQTLFPFNTLDEHSMKCLSSRFELLLKLEESVSLSLQPIDETVHCPNAHKYCPWKGHRRDLQVHLSICEIEEYKPTLPKKYRTD